MQDDTFSAAEKILYDIENVLKKDTNLQSFEIIPVSDSENKSPVYHEENSLALASWCVQPLYCYTYNRLIELRSKKLRREDPSIVSRWLLGAILLNPDVSTFWNMKRELVRSRRLDALQELRFTQIVLYHKAKCFEAFAYRRWLIASILVDNEHSSVYLESLLNTEMSVAAMSADRYANNYHAWRHREYVLTTYETLMPATFGSLLLSEWDFSRKWCSRHISDHSGNSYRQFLLKRLLLLERLPTESRLTFTPEQMIERRAIVLSYIKSSAPEINTSLLREQSVCDYKILELLHGKEKTECSDVNDELILVALSYWIEDCSVNEDLIIDYSGHESLWCHRRFLAYSLRCLDTSYAKYFCYNVKLFEPRHNRLENHLDPIHDRQDSKSLLEIAFRNRNEKIIALAKRKTEYRSDIVDKFVKFLTVLQLQS